MYLARGAAHAIAGRADTVTKLTSIIISDAGALPVLTELCLASAAFLQKLDQLSKVKPCCLTDLNKEHSQHIIFNRNN